jgi:hypothetical protein
MFSDSRNCECYQAVLVAGHGLHAFHGGNLDDTSAVIIHGVVP